MKPRLLVVAFDSPSAALALGAAQVASTGPSEVLPLVPAGLDPEGFAGFRLARPERLLAALAEARAADEPLVLEAESPGVAAAQLLEAGRIDGVLRLEPLPTRAGLRVRTGARVLCGQALKPSQALAGAGLLTALLGRPPSLVLLGTGQAASLRALNSYEVEAPGSYRDAARRRPDAWVTSTPSEAELLLGLLGTGPETVLELGGRRAWANPQGAPGPQDLRAALERLSCLAVSRDDLAASRDPVAPRVSVSARAPRPARSRCPYCHKHLSEYPDGRRGRPGPPILCAACGTGHHRDCLSEHGECTVMGCTSSVFTRLGASVGVSPLGIEDSRDWPFQSLPGDTGSGPSWLRVESPLEDLGSGAMGLCAHLVSSRVRRGEVVEGDLVLATSRLQRLRGATLELRASLSTRRVGDRATPWRSQLILARRACFLGEPPSGAFGRLGANVVNLLGGSSGIELPPGRRRYPFSFALPADHPRTLDSSQGEREERVRTSLVAVMGAYRVERELDVR